MLQRPSTSYFPGSQTIEYSMSIEGDVILYNIYDGDADNSVEERFIPRQGTQSLF